MAYRIEFTARAEADAFAAFEYIRAEAPAQAEQWYRGLEAAIDSLVQMPERCTLAPESKKLRRKLRYLLYGKHPGIYRIFFSIEKKEVVRIIHIRHGARMMAKKAELK